MYEYTAEDLECAKLIWYVCTGSHAEDLNSKSV